MDLDGGSGHRTRHTWRSGLRRHSGGHYIGLRTRLGNTARYFEVNLTSMITKATPYHTHTHTHTHNRFMALWILSGTIRVSRYQKKHSPTHTHRGHQSSLSAFSIYCDPWHPPYSIHVLYSFFHNFSPRLLSFTSWPGTLHFILHTLLHPIIIFFSQYHCNLFRCSTEIMSSKPSLRLNCLLGTLSCNFTPHIHLTILISAL